MLSSVLFSSIDNNIIILYTLFTNCRPMLMTLSQYVSKILHFLVGHTLYIGTLYIKGCRYLKKPRRFSMNCAARAGGGSLKQPIRSSNSIVPMAL